MSIMGIASLFFLIGFTLLYASKSLENKPGFVDRAAEKIHDNIDAFTTWGLVFGLIALVLTPLARMYGTLEVVIRVAANILIICMTLPYTLDMLLGKYQARVGDVLAAELRKLTSFVTSNEKAFAWAGIVTSVLLFAVLFR
jgi:hypothetical protein